MSLDSTELERVTTFLTGLLGTRYQVNGTGPNGFDCWTFTQHIQKILWSRQLADAPLPESGNIRELVRIIKYHNEHKNWRVVDRPVHSGLVELSCSRHPHHIGTWLDIDGGGLVHCDGPAGVTFDPLIALKAAGWRRFIFYEWAS